MEGQPTTVTVDDFLPWDPQSSQPLYFQSLDSLLPSLLFKAFAKLSRGYQHLKDPDFSRAYPKAMTMLTGLPCLKQEPSSITESLSLGYICSLLPLAGVGLLANHPYEVLSSLEHQGRSFLQIAKPASETLHLPQGGFYTSTSDWPQYLLDLQPQINDTSFWLDAEYLATYFESGFTLCTQ